MMKVAVIGMGGIGNIHATCYRNNPAADLVAVCDVVRAKADEAGEKHGCEVFYSLTEVLKAHPDLDIIDVRKQQLVWEGVVVGKVTDEVRDNLQAVCDEVVTEILSNYPYVAGNPTPQPLAKDKK